MKSTMYVCIRGFVQLNESQISHMIVIIDSILLRLYYKDEDKKKTYLVD